MRSAVGIMGLLVVGVFAGCLDGGGALNVPAPTWEPGYSFSYVEKGSVQVRVRGSDDGEKRTHEETRGYGPVRHLFEVVNTTMLAGTEPAYLLVAENQDETVAGNEEGDVGLQSSQRMVISRYLTGVRQRDLHNLGVGQSSEVSCSGPAQNPGNCRYALNGVTIHPGPSVTALDFPLTKGKSWSGTLEGGPEVADDEMGPGGLSVKISSRVSGRATVATPLGDVPAVRVESRLSLEGLDEFKRKMREEAKREGVTIEKFDLSMSGVTRYYYSEAYQTIVKHEYDFEQGVVIKGRSQEKSFDFSTNSHARGARELTGAHLIPRPERNLNDIARILSDQLPLADPTGKAYRSKGYAIDLKADRDAINVAQDGKVNFQASFVGVNETPSAQLKWSVVGPMGLVPGVSGSGTSLAYEFKEPGVYTVEVETVEGGNTTAADSVIVYAQYQSKVVLNCPEAALEPLLPGCPSVKVPVRPGVQRLTVKAAPSGPVPQLGSLGGMQLRLRDPGARQVTDASAPYEIEIVDFGQHTLSGADWTMQLYTPRAVMTDATYEIDIDVGGPTAAPPTPRMGSATLEGFVASWRAQSVTDTWARLLL